MFLVILAFVIALLPVYFVLAGFVELTTHTDMRRNIARAFAAGSAALTMSMRLQRRGV